MRRFKPWRYPAKWNFFRIDDRLLLMLIGAVVGICSGLAALALNGAIETMFRYLSGFRHYWWAFALPGAGAALSSLFLERVVKEGAGHGVPEVIYSVSRYGGLLRFRSSFSRIISSCLTIGSGGSAGPEAPVVMSGSAIGSNIARFFSLNDRQRVTVVGCGAAGAISSIFNAPISGLVFTIEVILGEWKSVNIIPIAIASVAGAEISRILKGNQIIFSHSKFEIGTLEIFACIGLAIFAAAASILLTHVLRSMGKLSGKAHSPLWVKAFAGGCAVGVVGLVFPVVYGEGYHWVQEMVRNEFHQGIALVAAIALAKIAATALTLGSGGSGGIFAPCLVIGSLVGLTYHRCLVFLWPTVHWVNEGCFALLGMAGLISGILQAPLTGIFLIVEITGGYGVILPLIIVSAISTSLCNHIEPASFYLKGLVESGQLLRPGTDARVLADLKVEELLEKNCIIVKQNVLLRDFIEIVKKSERNHFAVEHSETGDYLGMIAIEDVRPYIFNPEIYDAVFLEQIMTQVETVQPDDNLADVLDKMDDDNVFSLPVVSNNRFIGLISKGTLLDQYRKELMVQTNI